MNFRQISKKIDSTNDYLKVKRDIVDNIDTLTEEERQKIYKKYKKKFGEDEFWFLLRAIYKFSKCQDRVGE